MAFEWLVKLNDMMSDPASRIERQLFRVTQQLKALDVQAKQTKLATVTNPLQKMSLELQIQRDKLLMSKRAMEQNSGAASSLAGWVRHTREAMRDWLIILTPVTMGLSFIVNKAQQLAHTLASSIRSYEDAGLSLKNAFGPSGGADSLRQLQDIATRTGRPIQELFEQARQFATLGVSSEWIKPLILAISDMQALGRPNAGKLLFDLSAMWSRPVTDLNEIKRGLSGVVNETLMWEHLAKNAGVAVGNIDWAVRKNLVSGKSGIIALLQVIQEMEGGALGKMSFKRADTTMGGMLDRLEQRWNRLWMGVADTPGFKTFKSALSNLIAVLGNVKAQKAINDIANALGKAIEPLTGETGKKRMEEFFDSLAKKIKELIPSAETLEKAMRFLKGLSIGVSAVRHPFTSTLGNEPSDAKVKALDAAMLGGKTPGEALIDKAPFLGWLGFGQPSLSSGGVPIGSPKFTGIDFDPNRSPLLPSGMQMLDATASGLERANAAIERPIRRLIRIEKIEIPITVNAAGATKDDAAEIAKAIKDQVPASLGDALDQLNTEAP